MKEIAAMSITVLADEERPAPEEIFFIIGYITPDGAIQVKYREYPMPEEGAPLVINLAQEGIPDGVIVYPESGSVPGIGSGYRQAFVCQHSATGQAVYTLKLNYEVVRSSGTLNLQV